jgi:hypothetical protein
VTTFMFCVATAAVVSFFWHEAWMNKRDLVRVYSARVVRAEQELDALQAKYLQLVAACGDSERMAEVERERDVAKELFRKCAEAKVVIRAPKDTTAS